MYSPIFFFFLWIKIPGKQSVLKRKIQFWCYSIISFEIFLYRGGFTEF